MLPIPSAPFTRDRLILDELHAFGADVTDIALVPIRGELTNHHLAEYLWQILHQHGKSKIGLIFLVSDNIEDQENPELLEENYASAKYIQGLEAGLQELLGSVPDDHYVELAKQVAISRKLEIRIDFLHWQGPANAGARRAHLLCLAEKLKHPLASSQDTIIHLHDIDMRMSSTHFRELRRAYDSHPTMHFNMSEFDLVAGAHESVDQKSDIGREMLLCLDDYRLYQYGKLVKYHITGLHYAGTPALSGRFSHFFQADGQLYKWIQKCLPEYAVFEDYYLSAMGARAKQAEHYIDGAVGNYGEVFYLHRARLPNGWTFDDIVNDSAPDGETIYTVVTQKSFIGEGFEGSYDLLAEPERYIADLERRTARVASVIARAKGHTRTFLDGQSYQKILQDEMCTEREKVRRRVEYLHQYIEAARDEKPLAVDTEYALAPYIKYFPDEVAKIRTQLMQRLSSDRIFRSVLRQYDPFFNQDAQIHVLIARLRALKKYIFEHNISILDEQKEPALSGGE